MHHQKFKSMKTEKLIRIASLVFISMSALTFLYVSILALANPQGVMDLVDVKLANNDAISSIRGVYGGVGLSLSITLAYLAFTNVSKALSLLCLLWGFYAGSRVITIFSDGALGTFGLQWMTIEATFFSFAFTLLVVGSVTKTFKPAAQ